jgi:WD40 repeat protein
MILLLPGVIFIGLWRLSFTGFWHCCVQKTPFATGVVHSMTFHPKDSRVLAWGSTDGTVKVWNRATNEIRALHGHTSWVESVAFSPDGKWIASGSLDGTVKIWKLSPLPDTE